LKGPSLYKIRRNLDKGLRLIILAKDTENEILARKANPQSLKEVQ
jgi:hypothetical protein